jgi:hypothetical protein
MRLDILETFVTEEDIENGYIDDDSEDGICLSCKEHSCPSYEVKEDGSLSGNCVSACCGARIAIP